MFNALDFIKPFIQIIPTLKEPKHKLQTQEKLMWMVAALMIYLIVSQIPLYGVINTEGDPLSYLRKMMASNRGTLMELGIGPIITAGTIIQFLRSAHLMTFTGLREEQVLANGLEKAFALILTIGQAVAQITVGFYGKPVELGFGNAFIIVAQLFASGILIIFLDEILTNYAFGSGVNLFIAANVCENIAWYCFSPKIFNTARGPQFEGAFIGLVHILAVRKNKFAAIYEIFTRTGLPNLTKILSTLSLFTLVIFLHGQRVEIPIESKQVRGQRTILPIKLFYATTTPIVVQGYLFNYLCTISKILFKFFPKNSFVRLLGVWEETFQFGSIPVSGICRLVVPTRLIRNINIFTIIFLPFKIFSMNFLKGCLNCLNKDFLVEIFISIFYIATTLIFCSFFSRAWIDMNNNGTQSIVNQLKNDRMKIVGITENNHYEFLQRYVPTAAFLGGFIIGLIVLLADLMDIIGSGSNIFLCVSIVWKYFEQVGKDSLKKGQIAYF